MLTCELKKECKELQAQQKARAEKRQERRARRAQQQAADLGLPAGSSR